MPKRGREIEEDGSTVAVQTPPSLVTVKVMKGTEATSVKVDPSKYGFLSIQLQDEAYAQQFVNTDEVIADLSAAALGPEFASDIATTLDVADGRVAVTDVRLAAQTLRGADYLQLREDLYLEQVVAVLKQAAAPYSDVPPFSAAKEVVPCVHTGQLMWDRLGAYNVLRLERKGIISLGHKGIIDALREPSDAEVDFGRIDDELLALANVLNDVTSLDISWNKSITTCEPFADTLVELEADCSEITDEGLKLCTKLRKLNISWVNGVTSCAPFADTLEELQACGESCGMSYDTIRHCTKLRKLVVSGNPKITTCDSFKDLEELIPSEGFTAASLQKVAEQCHRLKCLIFANYETSEVTDLVIQKFAENCRHLQYLKLSRAVKLTDAAIVAVAENCRHLQHLNVCDVENLTDASIIAVADNCPQLQFLDVEGVGAITDTSIIKVAENCRHLQHLSVCGASDLTDASIIAVAANCPQLRSINASQVVNVTDTAIIRVAENCPDLEELNVAWTSNITDTAIKKVAEHCPRLQRLSVAATRGRITNTSIVEIAKSCPSLTQLNAWETGGKIGGDALQIFPSDFTGYLIGIFL